MYSVSLQNYNYNRRNGLCWSAASILILSFFLFYILGDIFGDVFTQKQQRHMISMSSITIVNNKKIYQKKIYTQDREIKNKEVKNIIDEVGQKQIVSKTEDLKQKRNESQRKDNTEKTYTEKHVKNHDQNMAKRQHNNLTQKAADEPVTEPSHIGINNTIPYYPIISFNIGEYGNVTIEYIVGKDGKIKYADITKSSGYIRLDKSAVIAFKKWNFKPSLNVFGQPVESSKKEITFSFNADRNTIDLK